MRYIFIVGYALIGSYGEGRGGVGLVIPNNQVLGSYLGELWLTSTDQQQAILGNLRDVLKGNGPLSHDSTDIGERFFLDFNSDTLIVRDIDDPCEPMTTPVSTKEFYDLAKLTLKIKREFKAAKESNQPWHGIPTKTSDEEAAQHKNDPSWTKSAMYYDSTTGKTGLWKDIEDDWTNNNQNQNNEPDKAEQNEEKK